MSNLQFYIKAGRWFYTQFEKLTIVPERKVLHLHRYIDFNCDYIDVNCDIRIYLNYGEVFYNVNYMRKLFKVFPISQSDFDTILANWVENKFNINVRVIRPFNESVY